jgi:hypothetical protein
MGHCTSLTRAGSRSGHGVEDALSILRDACAVSSVMKGGAKARR